jgi:hypothetical protein
MKHTDDSEEMRTPLPCNGVVTSIRHTCSFVLCMLVVDKLVQCTAVFAWDCLHLKRYCIPLKLFYGILDGIRVNEEIIIFRRFPVFPLSRELRAAGGLRS